VIHVDFKPDELQGEIREQWDRVVARAEKAKQAVLDAERPDDPKLLKTAIWADLKQLLFDHVFARKCAYCESDLAGHSFGDAEHWRPKRRVQRSDGTVVEGHSGYTWVAHDWENLVPACNKCNNCKGARFPIAREYVFTSDGGETTKQLNDIEKPLLLHPFEDDDRDPARHICFDEAGMPRPKGGSVEGAATIDVCGLDREDLMDARRKRFKELEDHIWGVLPRSRDRSIYELLSVYHAPGQRFSHASKHFVVARVPKFFDERKAEFESGRAAAEASG